MNVKQDVVPDWLSLANSNEGNIATNIGYSGGSYLWRPPWLWWAAAMVMVGGLTPVNFTVPIVEDIVILERLVGI